MYQSDDVIKAVLCVSLDRQVNMKVFVPHKLAECIPRSTSLPKERLRWNSNEVCIYT
jgi:hypothetical protein